MRTSPPKAPLAFRVGIVGHRPKRLAQAQADLPALASVVQQILRAMKGSVPRRASRRL